MSSLSDETGEKLSLPLSALKGVGPRRSALLEKLGLRSVEDLLFFFPRRYEDRRNIKKSRSLCLALPPSSVPPFAAWMSGRSPAADGV